MQRTYEIQRKGRDTVTIQELRPSASWFALVSTEADVTVHLGRSPAEPVLAVRAGGSGAVRVAQSVDAICLEWTSLLPSDGTSRPVAVVTGSTHGLDYFKHERDATPFDDVQDTAFVTVFPGWRVLVQPPARTPVVVSYPVLFPYDEFGAFPTAAPAHSSYGARNPVEGVQAAGLYAWDSAQSAFMQRLPGDATYGLVVQEARHRTHMAQAAQAAAPGFTTTALAAATDTQLAAFFKPALSGITARLLVVDFCILRSSAAADLMVTLDYLDGTTAPAGGTSITELRFNKDDAVSVSQLQRLPATPGSIAGHLGRQHYRLGITGAPSVVAPPAPVPWLSLIPDGVREQKEGVVLRSAAAEGAALHINASAATTIDWDARFYWTEE